MPKANVDDQRVLITGGAGFIGSHLSQELTDAGASVSVVDDLSVGSRELVPADVSFHDTDIRSPEFSTVVENETPTAIVHLAALSYVPDCEANPAEAYDINVHGTRNVLDVARDRDNLQTVVNASSAAVYPPQEGAITENSETGPIEVYGKTKVLTEDLARLFHTDAGVPTATARIFNPYGANDTNPHLIPAIIDQLKDGSRQIELGNLAPKRDYIHVRDVARALIQLVEFDGEYRAFNIGSGSAYSVREVVELIGEALGDEIAIEQDEERMRESDRPHLQADVSRIQSELGWEPEVSFVDGLRELLRVEDVA